MTARSIGEKPFRVCLFGTTAPTAEGLASLKGATRLAHAGDWLMLPPDSARVDAPASDDPLTVLPSFARAFPRETLILVRSDAVLPPHAFERLLRAIEFDHVLGAAALDGSSLDVATDRDDAERVDALCYAYGGRRLVDASLRGAAVSAWHSSHTRRSSGTGRFWTMISTRRPSRAPSTRLAGFVVGRLMSAPGKLSLRCNVSPSGMCNLA